MQTIDAHLGNMLTLFAAVSEEQPFRHQKQLVVYVPYVEYGRFVEMIVQTGKQWLWLPNKTYAKALQSASGSSLVKLLYYDVYRAMLGELALSVAAGKSCTVISPKFESVATGVSMEGVKQMCLQYPKYEEMSGRAWEDLRVFLGAGKFVSTEYYMGIFWYCVLLRILAMMKNPEKCEWIGG